MKRAIVLSGGGGKGAYQIGFWKAIRELELEYDIVTGTSIGALNGALMVQGNYHDAYKLWSTMHYEKIISDKFEDSFFDESGKRKVIMKYAKAAVKGGFVVEGLQNVIKTNLLPDKFYSSKIDYGLVTVKFPSLKPVKLTKKDIKEEELEDYLLATASCFPAFKMKEINNETYVDGAYHDNMPIELAISMGADEIIAVDLRPTYRRYFTKKYNVPVKYICSKSNIGNFLVLEKKQAKRSMRLGYNDTMKAFDELDGNFYTFKKGSLERNYDRLADDFFENLNKFNFKKIYGKDKEKVFDKALENLMYAFDIDESEIYRASVSNVLIRKKYKKQEELSYNLIKKIIKTNKLNKAFISKELICFIYNEIVLNKKTNIILNKLILLFPDSFLCAIYLKTIIK